MRTGKPICGARSDPRNSSRGRKAGPLTNRDNRLRNGHARRDAEDLEADVVPDLPLLDLQERLVPLDEPVLGHQEDELLEDAVGLDGAPLQNGPSAKEQRNVRKQI